jgi:hypothetical protein
VQLPWNELAGRTWQLTDVLSGEIFERNGDEMQSAGLYVDVPAWSFHFLHFQYNQNVGVIFVGARFIGPLRHFSPSGMKILTKQELDKSDGILVPQRTGSLPLRWGIGPTLQVPGMMTTLALALVSFLEWELG